jgi:IclR family transcriptional regulator, KDG regulon repressor
LPEVYLCETGFRNSEHYDRGSSLIKSYDKLFSILDYVKTHPHEKLQTIADELGMSKSTLHRIVKELVEYGMLTRDDKTLTYKLGTRLLEYGSAVIENLDIRKDADESISRLNRETKETIHLAILADNRVVYVDKRESLHAIRMYSLIGKEAPIHCTAVGKAIAAFQPQTFISRLLQDHKLEAYTPYTITDKEKLQEELSNIRKTGIAVDREEHESGIICAAAPIRDYKNEVYASISITSITQRMTLEQLLALKEKLVTAADAISRKLGYNRSDGITGTTETTGTTGTTGTAVPD